MAKFPLTCSLQPLLSSLAFLAMSEVKRNSGINLSLLLTISLNFERTQIKVYTQEIKKYKIINNSWILSVHLTTFKHSKAQNLDQKNVVLKHSFKYLFYRHTDKILTQSSLNFPICKTEIIISNAKSFWKIAASSYKNISYKIRRILSETQVEVSVFKGKHKHKVFCWRNSYVLMAKGSKSAL